MTVVLKKPVIAVAGSSGKTTTKEMIAAILKQRWKIYSSQRNRNNRRHIRVHVKHIKPYHRAVVLEFGMSYRGNLTHSCQIIKPNMAIITMVGTSHIGNFGGSLPRLIRAKSELIQHMQQTGTLFLNVDDKNSRLLHKQKFRGKIVKVGISRMADYRATHVAYAEGGMTFEVKLSGRSYNFFIPTYGHHNVYNALFAIALTHTLDFNAEEISAGLKVYHQPGRRLKVYNLKSGMRVIDDTFNANPNSVKAALDVLTAIGKGKNVAVLGNMGELGAYSYKGHSMVGKYAAGKKDLSQIYTFGTKTRVIARAARQAGFPRHRIIHSVKRATLHKYLVKELQPGSTILVKGSNSMKMNKTVSFLKSRYS